jgi:arabinofuranosyltransferase
MPKKTSSKASAQKSKTLPKAKPAFNAKAVLIPALIIIGILFYYYCKSFNFVQDDSYITSRYVKNFTEGHGLVFNIGERVEGYTCFLWVLLLSLFKTLGFNFISFSQTSGIIFSLLALYFTFRISTDIFKKEGTALYISIFSLGAVVMTMANGAFAYWSVSGMETGMFGFLVTLGIYLYLKEIKQGGSGFNYSSIIFLLASLTRPEGVLIFSVTVLHKIIISVQAKKENKISGLISKDNIIWISAYVIPAVIYMIWRYSYYGYLLPNTFYAKTGGLIENLKSGLNYFVDFATVYGLYGLLLIVPFFTVRNKERFNLYLYLLMVFYIFCLYVIFVGGDVLRPARFFVPLMPVFYILVQEGIAALLGMFEKKNSFTLSSSFGTIIILMIAYITYKPQFDQIKDYSRLENGLVDKMRLSGQWLKNKQSVSGKNLTVAATTIGAISYFSEVTLIDMLGLTDAEVAHNPQPIPEISANSEIGWKERNYNVNYILSRKPDYIYFSTGVKPSAYAERGLFTNDEFIKYYYPSYFTIKEYNFTDCIYKRKTEEEVKNIPAPLPNPNYKKIFVNLYNQAMNTSRDKSKLQEALNLYKQTLDAAPSNFGTPYQMIGDIYLQMNNKEKAFENYKKSIEIDDYNVLSHYALYSIYMEKGDTVNASLSLKKLQKYSPDMLK